MPSDGEAGGDESAVPLAGYLLPKCATSLRRAGVELRWTAASVVCMVSSAGTAMGAWTSLSCMAANRLQLRGAGAKAAKRVTSEAFKLSSRMTALKAERRL
ncbi:hypothetical protein KCP69_20890 [Salmonella enterica subsp. enterica]|nr:hypothetical protein KCP69_20890 [Salmonella enterica subsp. enterica]